jgi:two-component system response regulator HydG
MKKTEVLVVDDERDTCELLEMALARQGMQVTTCTTAADALEKIASRDFDVVLTDLSMPETSGLEVCERVIALRPDVPVVLITGHATLETAMAAIRAGAYDFVTKPIESKTLGVVVSRAVQHRRLREQIKMLRAARDANQSIIVGGSPAMRKVADLIERVGDSDASVLIHGETGTGKELVARAVHNKSKRREGPFVAINCAAVPHSLHESELFGHARGAFTGATQDRPGLFEAASGGTLLLDEVGDVPMAMQVKLLRALQEREVRRVGENRSRPVDVRIIAATNRDLAADVVSGRFRQDLYYRLRIIELRIPPLRERAEDILPLARLLLAEITRRLGLAVDGFTPRAAQRLVRYAWPGNVRELANALERAAVVTTGNRIDAGDLPDETAAQATTGADASTRQRSRGPRADTVRPLADVERDHILSTLDALEGNKAKTAAALGIGAATLFRKLRQYEA